MAGPGIEEVTASQVLGIIRHRWISSALAFLIVFSASTALAALQPPMHEASMSILPMVDPASTVAIISSDAYAEAVAVRAGLVDRLGGGNVSQAGREVKSHAFVAPKTETRGEQAGHVVVSVRVRWTDPELALLVAQNYQATLDQWTPTFRDLAFNARWESFYERFDRNATRAHDELAFFLQSYTYQIPLDNATLSSGTLAPDRSLTLGAGLGMAAFSAFLVPLSFEAASRLVADRPPAPEGKRR